MENKASRTLAALSALAHETRLEIFRLLVQAGDEGLAAGEIARRLQVAPATLSFHLKELKIGGVVACERQGRSLIYRPAFDAMKELLDYLMENCCAGAEVEATPSPARRRA